MIGSARQARPVLLPTGNVQPSQEQYRGNLSGQLLCAEPSSDDSTGEFWSQLDLRSVARALLFALVGFVLGCLAIGLLIPAPIDLYTEIRSEKLALAQKWARYATVVAFGSSHVDCGFDPRVFDANFRGEGQGNLSLNLAVSGGGQVEQAAMADKFLSLAARAGATRKRHLLLLEMNLGANFPPKFLTHPRAINIYGWKNLQLALRFSDPSIGAARALGRAGYAFAVAALNFMNTGMLSSQVFARSLSPAIVENQTVSDRRGLSPPPQIGEVNPELLKQAVAAGGFESEGGVTPGYCAVWRRLTGRAAGTNISVMFIITPKLTDLNGTPAYPAALDCDGTVVPIIDVARPDLHPELYSLELWWDATHLNERGAGVYTRLLARAVDKATSADQQFSLDERVNAVH